MLCIQVSGMSDFQDDSDENWDSDIQLLNSSQYSDCMVRFPMTPVHTTTIIHTCEKA